MNEGDKIVYVWGNELRTGTVISVQTFQMLVERDWLTREHQERMLDLVVDDAVIKEVTPGAFIAIRRMFDKGLEDSPAREESTEPEWQRMKSTNDWYHKKGDK